MGNAAVAPASPPQGDFARLLETERRLEERLRAARREADALIARAWREAAAREAAAAAEIQDDEQRTAETLDAERLRREAEIAAAAQAEIEAYQRIPPVRLTAVARALAQRLFDARMAAP